MGYTGQQLEDSAGVSVGESSDASTMQLGPSHLSS